jgi:hypothetical protein
MLYFYEAMSGICSGVYPEIAPEMIGYIAAIFWDFFGGCQ